MRPSLKIRVHPDADGAEIAREIKNLAPSLVCGSCGNNDFALLEDNKNNLRSFIQRGNVKDPMSTQSIFVQHPMATLVCMTCGHMEFFSDGVLSQMADPSEWGEDVDELM